MNRAIVTSGLSLLLVALGHASAMSKFRLPDILKATRGEPCGFRGEPAFPRIGIDSRTTQPGELFWALRGENYDGHDFVRDATSRGAAARVVSADRYKRRHRPAIVVPDTLQALWEFAAWHRSQLDAVVIGVTGSFGKTTTREMIHAVLTAGHTGFRSSKNYNNHVGVPLTLLEMTAAHEFAIVELAASAAGEIRDLAEMAKPEIGVLTGIGPSHLDGLTDIDGVLSAKSELLEGLPESGFLVANGDDPFVRAIAEESPCPVIFVGQTTGNDLVADRVEVGTARVRFRVDDRDYELPAVGRHHVTDALIAIAIGREIGLSAERIAGGLATFEPVAGRCRLENIGPWRVIDDSYNANPDSMRAACVALRDWPEFGRRILVAGDMKELGDAAAESHRAIGRFAAESAIEHVIAYGEFAGPLVAEAKAAGMHASQLAECDSLDAVLTVLDCWLEPGDVVLVKGSRALRMERVIEELKQRTQSNNRENTARPLLRASA
ncbi:MAG: UDP-N-acetylmuramoyl-tripeptide--D-alanyl-D-alanine ligase [Planctomycetaceae bacterium]